MQRRPRGFTLIELMMTVAIAGILAAILLPSYRNFVCRTHVTEAKTTLRAIYSYEEAYRSEYDHYLDQPYADVFMINPMLTTMGSRRYSYDVVGNVADFTGTADGIGPMTGDTWTVDQSMSLNWVAHHPNCE
jgi:prepilin-type N-terminal cleavage/methylation domain-containing protein